MSLLWVDIFLCCLSFSLSGAKFWLKLTGYNWNQGYLWEIDLKLSSSWKCPLASIAIIEAAFFQENPRTGLDRVRATISGTKPSQADISWSGATAAAAATAESTILLGRRRNSWIIRVSWNKGEVRLCQTPLGRDFRFPIAGTPGRTSLKMDVFPTGLFTNYAF